VFVLLVRKLKMSREDIRLEPRQISPPSASHVSLAAQKMPPQQIYKDGSREITKHVYNYVVVIPK